MQIFHEKIRFTLSGYECNGYVSSKGIEEAKGLIYPSAGYIHKETLVLPNSIFGRESLSSLNKINIRTRDVMQDYESIEYVYKYAMLSNDTAIPIFLCIPLRPKLAGFVFPPACCDNPETIFVPVYDDRMQVNYSNYIKIFKNEIFNNIPRVFTVNDVKFKEDFFSGVLYIDNEPTLVVYINEKKFELKLLVNTLSNALISSYINHYAHSLLSTDEVLMVEDSSFSENVNLYGVAAGGNIRDLGYGSPMLIYPKSVVQPYIYKNDYNLGINVPYRDVHGVHISTMCEKRRDIMGVVDPDFFSSVLDIAEWVEEMRYTKEVKPYSQVFGCNRVLSFPNDTFAKRMLNWIGG